MKFEPSKYNPLEVLFTLDLESGLTPVGIGILATELQKGGIVPEDEKEVEIILHLLTKLQKEYNGKK